jgi:hypothetical protein
MWPGPSERKAFVERLRAAETPETRRALLTKYIAWCMEGVKQDGLRGIAGLILLDGAVFAVLARLVYGERVPFLLEGALLAAGVGFILLRGAAETARAWRERHPFQE